MKYFSKTFFILIIFSVFLFPFSVSSLMIGPEYPPPFAPPSPEKYAPNLWFDSDENYYPTSPFFDDDDIGGIDNKEDYESLTLNQKQKEKFKVFCHIVETEDEIVYEYWFYYVYNKMPLWNEHYHDWEKVFVFVNKETEEVNRVVGSAHWNVIPNNELSNPDLEKNEHIGILVEQGSHASCPDENNDGLFQRGIDITNGYIVKPIPYAYGILGRDSNDLNGYKIKSDNPYYTLQEIDNDFITQFGGFENFQDPTLGICVNVPSFFGFLPCIPIGGKPAGHPWFDEAYDNPYKIIPKHYSYIHGTINPLFIPGLSNPTLAIILLMSEEPYHYGLADKDGNFTINGDIEPGSHDLIINLDGYAPYKQRFIIEENENEENEIVIGVDGILNLIPENEAFKLKGTVKDSDGNIVVNSEINIYDEDGNKLFTTLTDEEGHYLFNLSSKNTYTVEVIKKDKIEKSENIKGAIGTELIVNLSIENPKLLKIQSIEKLNRLKNDNSFINQKINQMIKSIQLGLNDNLWIDDTHLKEKDFQGRKVFFSDLMAAAKIKHYSRIIKKNRKKDKIPKNLFKTFNEVSNNLTKADYLLAKIAIDELKNTEIKNNRFKKRIEKLIEKSEKEFKKAKQKLEKNKPIKSIAYSQKSWIYSKMAMRLTETPDYFKKSK